MKQQGADMAFEDRKYIIIPAAEIANVDFTQVLETSAETCRYSVDGTKTFIKYEGDMPSSISTIANKSQEYSYGEILELLSSLEWTSSIEEL